MSLSDIKVIDLHSDIWVDVADKRLKGERRVFESRHLEKLKKNQVGGLVYSLFTWEKIHYDRQPDRYLEMLAANFADLSESPNTAYVKNISEYEKAVKEDKFALFGMVEGLYGFGGNPDVIYLLKEVGIRVLGLVWSVDNEYGTGCNTTTDKGLTPEGIEALKIAQKLGLIIDVSHMSEASFWDVEKNVDGIFIASHSNCSSLWPALRNITDDQIKAVAAHGGIIGLVAWPDNLGKDPSIEKLVDHAVHISELVGPEYLGLGFDFTYWSETWNKDFSKDGKAKATIGLEDITGVPRLLKEFEKRGFSESEIEGIASKNFLRVFEKVCG